AWPAFLWSRRNQDAPWPWVGLVLLILAPMFPFKIFRSLMDRLYLRNSLNLVRVRRMVFPLVIVFMIFLLVGCIAGMSWTFIWSLGKSPWLWVGLFLVIIGFL